MENNLVSFQRVGLLLFLVVNLAFAISPQAVNVTPNIKHSNQAHKVKFDTLVIQKIDVIDHGNKLSWYAMVKNIGNTIAKDKLEISAYQFIGNRQISKAGEKIVWNKRFEKNQLFNFTKQNWSRAKDATTLKIVVKNLQTGKSVSKIASIPKQNNKHTQGVNNVVNNSSLLQQNAGILNKRPKLIVLGATYRGRGAFDVKIKNVGERGFMPNEIEIRPIYYIGNNPPMIGKIITNQSAINVNKWKRVLSNYPNIYDNGMAECLALNFIGLEITNKATGDRTEYNINGNAITRPDAEIQNVNLEGSRLTYTVHNKGDYTAKFYIRTISFAIYHWETEAVSNIPVYWNNKIKNLEDLFHTAITLKAGETSSVTISPQRVNNEIKIQYPNMKKETPYMAQYFKLELFMKGDTRCISSGRDIPISQSSFTYSSSNSGFAIFDQR